MSHGRAPWRICRAGLAAGLLGLAPAGATACGLALAIGLDVSGSVNGSDYRLQIEGTARALLSTRVRALFLAEAARGAPVALLVFEWSESGAQALVSDWTLIDSDARVTEIAYRLIGHSRSIAPDATGIGSAVLFAAAQFDRVPLCQRRTIDLSGDGRNNTPPDPAEVRHQEALDGITINGLVIGASGPQSEVPRLSDLDDLASYYSEEVISGPGAFVERAEGFAAVEAAMIRKLVREIPAVAVGQGPAPDQHRQSGLADPIQSTAQ